MGEFYNSPTDMATGLQAWKCSEGRNVGMETPLLREGKLDAVGRAALAFIGTTVRVLFDEMRICNDRYARSNPPKR